MLSFPSKKFEEIPKLESLLSVLSIQGGEGGGKRVGHDRKEKEMQAMVGANLPEEAINNQLPKRKNTWCIIVILKKKRQQFIIGWGV